MSYVGKLASYIIHSNIAVTFVSAMLEWFVSKSDVDSAINEDTFLNNDIECRPEK